MIYCGVIKMTEMAAEQINTDIKATYLSAEDLKLAASLLYQSYHDDPVFFSNI